MPNNSRFVPQEAIDLFEKGASARDVYEHGVIGYYGEPASYRSCRRYRNLWAAGLADPGDPDEELLAADDPEELMSAGTQERVKFTTDGDVAEASSISTRIRTLDDLLDAAEVDLGVWQVVDYIVNSWEVPRKAVNRNLSWHNGKINGYVIDDGEMNVETCFQVKVRLGYREIAPYEESLDDLLDIFKDNVPEYKHIRPVRPETGVLFVPNIYDAHVGKASDNGEYTIEDASIRFVRSMSALVAQAQAYPYQIKRILFPVGHDILHADNLFGQTSRGTKIEMSGDIRKAIRYVAQAVKRSVDMLATIAPVDIITVPGNHDRMNVTWLGEVLRIAYEDHPNVFVVAEEQPMQYYQYEDVFICLTHGDRLNPADLALVAATDAPDMWGATKHRLALIGHLHQQRKMIHLITEKNGFTVYMIPALCDTDEYHRLRGYIGNTQAAEGMFIGGGAGVIASFFVV